MPCILTGLTQPVCLTIIYNISSQKLKESFIDCVGEGEECILEATFNPDNTDLTITVPLTLEGEVTFTDNPFQSFCVTKGLIVTPEREIKMKKQKKR
jgi:hypothetical protein